MADLLHDLHIDPGALIVNLVSFVLLVWLMKRFLFGPIGSFIEQRKGRIAQDLDEAEEERRRAQAERAEIEARRGALISAAETAAAGIRQQAEQEADEMRAQARAAAREMERIAHAATEREREQAAAALRGQLSDTSLAMCRRLLAEALDEERHRALMEQLISDIEQMAAGESRS